MTRRILVLNRFSLASARYPEWVPDDAEVHLVTTQDSLAREADTSGYASVHALADYRVGGGVELLAERLHRRHHFDDVVAASEYDLLRAARMTTRWGLPGWSVAQVLRVRDKVVMKEALQAGGVPVAPWAAIDDVLSLVAAVEAIRLPVVVKSRLGAASRDVLVLRSGDDVEKFVAGSARLGEDRPAGLLIERFIPGTAFHVDGFIHDGRVLRRWPSETTPNLELTEGRSLVSSMLEADDPRWEPLVNLTDAAVAALGTPDVGLFHAEVFGAPDGRFLLNEVGARVGGGRIKEVVRRAFGVDPLEWYVRARFDTGTEDPAPLPLVQAGYAKAGARSGRVVFVPLQCPAPGVASYYPNVHAGEHMSEPKSTDDFLASFVAVAPDRASVLTALTAATAWARTAYRIAPTDER